MKPVGSKKVGLFESLYLSNPLEDQGWSWSSATRPHHDVNNGPNAPLINKQDLSKL